MTEEKHKGERIAKRMARAGICSRRDAERYIEAGRVKVNGQKISSPALNVTDNDIIKVDNKDLPSIQQTRLYMYHKPPGLITSHKDEQGRTTLFDELPEHMPRVVSVGRLDLNTEGLLLLTNDGELSRFLELPSTGWSRKYRVRVHGKVDERRLSSLKNGITVEGVRYKSIIAKLEENEGTGANSWISITLKEGKNREIRRVMEFIGLRVTRLIRTDYGPFSLGSMNRGTVEEIKPHIMKAQIAKYFGDKSEKNVHQQKTKKDEKSPQKTKNHINHRNNSHKKSKKSKT